MNDDGVPMLYTVIKVLVSALLIVAISEVAKRSTLFGALIASLPLVSILAMIWLFVDTRDVARIAELSTSIFWLVIPSLALFLLLPLLLNRGLHFYLALSISALATAAFYALTLLLLQKFGVRT
jgi:hypothetical protein